jgi:hypothetical protein
MSPLPRILISFNLSLGLPAAGLAAGTALFDGTLNGWDAWLGRPDKSLDLPVALATPMENTPGTLA